MFLVDFKFTRALMTRQWMTSANKQDAPAKSDAVQLLRVCFQDISIVLVFLTIDYEPGIEG